MSDATFNLDDLLRELVNNSQNTDPDALVQAAFESIDPSDRSEALRQAIELIVEEGSALD